MTANINNFGVINIYENNAPKQEPTKKAEPVCEDVTPDEPPAPVVVASRKQGRKTQYLFSDASGNEDITRAATEAERVRRYIADHKMGNMQLDSQFTNRLNLLVACFWYRWNERDWVGDEPQGAAIYRFFTEQCGLECAVLPKAFSTKICKIISAGKKDPEIYANLDSYFRE